jgi:hypothetical protein
LNTQKETTKPVVDAVSWPATKRQTLEFFVVSYVPLALGSRRREGKTITKNIPYFSPAPARHAFDTMLEMAILRQLSRGSPDRHRFSTGKSTTDVTDPITLRL